MIVDVFSMFHASLHWRYGKQVQAVGYALAGIVVNERHFLLFMKICLSAAAFVDSDFSSECCDDSSWRVPLLLLIWVDDVDVSVVAVAVARSASHRSTEIIALAQSVLYLPEYEFSVLP